MQIIPLSKVPSQKIDVTLNQQDCTISIYWRQIYLYLDLALKKETICTGAICINKTNILQLSNSLFAGSLHFFDTESDRSPDFKGLFDGYTGRYYLVYVTPDEPLPETLSL